MFESKGLVINLVLVKFAEDHMWRPMQRMRKEKESDKVCTHTCTARTCVPGLAMLRSEMVSRGQRDWGGREKVASWYIILMVQGGDVIKVYLTM